MRVTQSVRIDAPAATVWRVLADVGRWPEMTPTMLEVTPLDADQRAGVLRVGERYRVRQPRLPVTVYTVDDVVEGVGFSWASGPRRARGRAVHEIVALGDDACEVTLGVTQHGLVAPVGWLMAGLVRRYLATEAAGLRGLCERG